MGATVQACDSGSHYGAVISEKEGTSNDQKDMYRMGKTQELRRNFRFVSIFGYSMILMATWETVLTYAKCVRLPLFYANFSRAHS